MKASSIPWRSYVDRRHKLQWLMRSKMLATHDADMVRGSAELRSLYPQIAELEKEIAVLKRVLGKAADDDDEHGGENRSVVEYRFAPTVTANVSQSTERAIDGDPSLLRLRGYAVLFGELSRDLGGFRERFDTAAFDSTLRDDDQEFLIEHQLPTIASTRDGTLTLEANRDGLRFEATLDRGDRLTQRVEPLLRARRSMSFAFITLRDRWQESRGQTIRTVQAVKLLEISAVKTPAYPQTSLAVSERSHGYRERHLHLLQKRCGIAPMEQPPPAMDREIMRRLACQLPKHRDKLRRLYAAAIANNQFYFNGKLKLPNIIVEDLSRRNARAQYRHRKVPVIVFDRRILETGSDDGLANTLLHEQVHQALAFVGDRPSGKHGWHHAEFAKVANRIAKQRGWPDCSPHKTEGLTAAKHWPPLQKL